MDVKEIINLLKNLKNNETLVIDYKGIRKVLIDNE
jgi:hypothetical protein